MKEMSDTITISKKTYDELLNMWAMASEKAAKYDEMTNGEEYVRHSIYNNLPFEDIDQYVKEDLSRFDQENPAPLSMTVLFEKDGYKMFRHYELGCIIGYILIGYIPENEDYSISPMISEIHEDDEYWFAPNTPMHMAASWMNNSRKTFERMYNWYHEHIKEGFEEDGKWHEKFLKEIVPEEIYNENGMSSCELFAGPDNE